MSHFYISTLCMTYFGRFAQTLFKSWNSNRFISNFTSESFYFVFMNKRSTIKLSALLCKNFGTEYQMIYNWNGENLLGIYSNHWFCIFRLDSFHSHTFFNFSFSVCNENALFTDFKIFKINKALFQIRKNIIVGKKKFCNWTFTISKFTIRQPAKGITSMIYLKSFSYLCH